MSALSSIEREIKERVKTRHYYLKQAYNSIKLKDITHMHKFCFLAELEQKLLDDLHKIYPSLC
jgi:hypothetical protein